jgi:hypothetical protein
MEIRYIRDEIYNSPDGKGQWAEIRAFSNGENVALNKPVSSSLTVNKPLTIITDGNDGNVSGEFVESTSYGAIEIDLGESYKVEEIQVCHYWDGRIYGHIVSGSPDGVIWYPIYNTEINGEYPSFHSGKTFTIPDEIIIPIRYIKDWCADSTANPAGIWSEIKVFRNEENIALGILATSSVPLLGGTGIITNGIINPNEYSFSNSYGTPIYVELDLGEIYTDLTEIIISHYGDGRTFFKTKTEVSTDGVNWHTLFDSAISGTYAETWDGFSILLSSPKTKLLPIKIGEINIDKIFLGEQSITKVYLGANLLGG